MDTQDQDVRLNLDEPAEGEGENVTETEESAEDAKKNSSPESVEGEESVKEDRAAFNCQPCGGEGLLPNGKVCDTCHGTGKV